MKNIVLACMVAAAAIAATAQTKVIVLEGARVIVGDGKVIDNATIVVDGDRFSQVGPAAGVKIPPGASRVSRNESATTSASVGIAPSRRRRTNAIVAIPCLR